MGVDGEGGGGTSEGEGRGSNKLSFINQVALIDLHWATYGK